MLLSCRSTGKPRRKQGADPRIAEAEAPEIAPDTVSLGPRWLKVWSQMPGTIEGVATQADHLRSVHCRTINRKPAICRHRCAPEQRRAHHVAATCGRPEERLPIWRCDRQIIEGQQHLGVRARSLKADPTCSEQSQPGSEPPPQYARPCPEAGAS